MGDYFWKKEPPCKGSRVETCLAQMKNSNFGRGAEKKSQKQRRAG